MEGREARQRLLPPAPSPLRTCIGTETAEMNRANAASMPIQVTWGCGGDAAVIFFAAIGPPAARVWWALGIR